MAALRLLAVTATATALLACGGPPRPAAPPAVDLWRHVPADSPLVVGTTRPMEPTSVDLLLGLLASTLEGAESGLDESADELGDDLTADLFAPARRAFGRADEHLTHEGLASIGVGPGQHTVAYVDARALVLRVGLVDPALTVAFLDRLAADPDLAPRIEATTRSGHRRWQFDLEGAYVGSVVVAGQWVLVLGTADEAPAALERALGPAPATPFTPARIGPTSEDRGLPLLLVGHADLPRLVPRVATFVPGLDSPACAAELSWLARALPVWAVRVTGDTTTFHEAHALRWPPDIAAQLPALATGLAHTAGSTVPMGGVGLNVEAAWKLLADGLGALTARRFDCPALAELPGGAGMAALGLSQAVDPSVLALRGFDVRLTDDALTLRVHTVEGGAAAFAQLAGIFVAPAPTPDGWGALVAPIAMPGLALTHGRVTSDTVILTSSPDQPLPPALEAHPGVLAFTHGAAGDPNPLRSGTDPIAAAAWMTADPSMFYRDTQTERWLRIAPEGLRLTSTLRSSGPRPLLHTATARATTRQRRAQLAPLCRAADTAPPLPPQVPTARVDVPGAGAPVPPFSLAIANDGVRIAGAPDERPDTWATTRETLTDMVRTALADDRQPDLTLVPAPDLPLPVLRIALADLRTIGFTYVVLVARGAPTVVAPGPPLAPEAAAGPTLDAAFAALRKACPAAATGVRQVLAGIDCTDTLTPIAQTVALCPAPAAVVDRALGAALALDAPTVTVALDLRQDLPAPLQGDGTWADAAAALFARDPVP